MPDLVKELVISAKSVVRIGPRQRCPAIAVNERHFGPYSTADVYTMREVLRRRQHKFRGLDIAGIEIDGSWHAHGQVMGQPLFHRIGSELKIRESTGVDQTVKGDKLPNDIGTGLVAIVIRLAELPDIACEIGLTKFGEHGVTAGRKALLIGSENAYYQLDRRWLFKRPHSVLL